MLDWIRDRVLFWRSRCRRCGHRRAKFQGESCFSCYWDESEERAWAETIEAFHLAAKSQEFAEAMRQFAGRMNHATPEQIGRALEACDTETLDWATRFEAMGHEGKL